jgi:ribosome-associated protein
VTRDDDRTARQISRSKTKRAGDRSATMARTLMELKDSQLAKLDLEEDLRADVTRARKITSHIARRRAERSLAGDLRKYDLAEVDEQLAKLSDGGAADARQFHLAEQWRARLIAEGMAAAAELPGGNDPDDHELPRLIDAAQRERDTGKPPGAARALFRYVVGRLKD